MHVKQQMDAIYSIQVLVIDKVEWKAHVDASSAWCCVWVGLDGKAWRRGCYGWTEFLYTTRYESRWFVKESNDWMFIVQLKIVKYLRLWREVSATSRLCARAFANRFGKEGWAPTRMGWDDLPDMKVIDVSETVGYSKFADSAHSVVHE